MVSEERGLCYASWVHCVEDNVLFLVIAVVHLEDGEHIGSFGILVGLGGEEGGGNENLSWIRRNI